MKHLLDVLVIGTGTAGATLALECRKAGLKVAVVDNRPYGGTCAMRGCQPKKYLVEAAQVAYLSRQMSEIGISPAACIDWPALVRSTAIFTNAVPERTEKEFKKAGIELFYGTARFISPVEVKIDDKNQVLAKNIVIATGAKPSKLDIPGSDLAITSDDFMILPTLPKRILFIGGGYISLEFAHVAWAAGAEVTILHRGERILDKFDAELTTHLTESARTLGISIITGITADKIVKNNGTFVTYGKAVGEESFSSDLIVNASGRVADLNSLDLKAGNVSFSAHGVTVNEFLQSISNPHVRAIGDACESPLQLSTVADMEALVAANNIINGNIHRADYQGIPSVVFTQPPLAGVGITEVQAVKAGKQYRINRGSMDSWPSSRRIGQKHAFYKVLIEEDSEKILGAHIFGHNAGEVINVFAMAIKFGLSTHDLKSVLWAYPTNVSDLKYMIS